MNREDSKLWVYLVKALEGTSRQSGRKPMYMPAVLRPNHEFPPHPKLAKSRTFGDDADARAKYDQRHHGGNAFGNFPGFGVFFNRNNNSIQDSPVCQLQGN